MSDFDGNDDGIGTGGELTAAEETWAQQGALGALRLLERTAPSTVASNGLLYVKSSDNLLYFKNSSGVESAVSLGAGSVPTTITVADEAADTTCFPLFVTAATGDLGPKTNSGLSFNSSTGVLTATGFSGPLTGNVTGNVSGTAATVTGAAQAAITSLGTLTGLTMGGNLVMGTNSITMTGSIAATGARVTKGWFTDIESTNMPTVGGTSLSSTFAPLTSPTFGTSITGSYLTASEILITDGSKNIVSAAVATYPSLTELTYVKGVTSAIQTQINAKAPSTSPTFATSITGSYLTASEILITDGSKNIVSAAVATYPSLTELTYLKGVTSAIQTQFTAKAPLASPSFTGTVTLPTGLTGVLRADSGVVSVDSDVTDIVAAASESAAGKIEIATTAEIDTGTDTGRAMAPDQFAVSNRGKRIVQLKIFDDATAATTGDGKLIFMIPVELNGMNLVDCEAFVTGTSSSGALTVQVRNVTQAADMLSTAITIDQSENSSLTAATAPVIDTGNDDVATGDLIAIDVDGAGTSAEGLGVILSFQTP